MLKFIFVYLLIIFSAQHALAEKPKPACVSANPEQISKASAAFQDSEYALSLTWRDLKVALDDQAFAKLRTDQISWLEYRNQAATKQTYGQHKACALAFKSSANQDRKAFLMAQFEPMQGDPSGMYVDTFGGHLLWLEDHLRASFQLDITRTDRRHGTLAGAELIDKRTDQPRLLYRMRSAKTYSELQIIRDNHVLTLKTDPSRKRRNAFFDGRYVRVRQLTDQEKLSLQALRSTAKEHQ